ncbi:MAG: Hsp20/alpha crystallin family protein [Candidatus Eremiobacteraeota bacterium]|nr:Hsp20/alpha crystallin family protein [Candidatus Eremiobacteraeota bacterium]
MDFVIRGRLGGFEPNADVFVDEENRRVVAVIEVAGADAESLRIGIEDRQLMIAGRRAEAIRLRHGSFAQKEIAYGEFAKCIALPAPVEYDGAAASYDNGVLVIALPISPTAYRRTARTELHILVKRTHT